MIVPRLNFFLSFSWSSSNSCFISQKVLTPLNVQLKFEKNLDDFVDFPPPQPNFYLNDLTLLSGLALYYFLQSWSSTILCYWRSLTNFVLMFFSKFFLRPLSMDLNFPFDMVLKSFYVSYFILSICCRLESLANFFFYLWINFCICSMLFLSLLFYFYLRSFRSFSQSMDYFFAICNFFAFKNSSCSICRNLYMVVSLIRICFSFYIKF